MKNTKLAHGIEEAAELLGISRSRMFQVVAAGEIGSYKEGRKRMISARALAAYIDAKEQAGREAA